MSKFIQNILLITIPILFLISCSVTKTVPVQEKIVYNYIDSLRIKDSTVIIPIERIVDIVPQYDTLTLETSLAKSVSYVDTSLHLLRGSIANKTGITERIVYQDRIIKQVDSIYVEKPVEVEVIKTKAPSILWYSLGFNLLILIIVIIKLYLKFK